MLSHIRQQSSVAIIAISLAPTMAIAQTCPVPETGWIWWSDLIYETDMTSGPYPTPESYNHWIGVAVTKYDATDIDLGAGSNGEGEIAFINANMGPNGVLGAATPYWGSVPCFTWINMIPYSNYFCNYTTTRPDNGVVWLNDFNLSNRSILALDYGLITIMHEIGHLLGLGHAYPGCNSIMMNNLLSTTSDFRSWETMWLNAQY